MQHLNNHKKTQPLLSRMNLMDDPFFQKIAEDNDVCQELLQILLNKPGLQIAESQAQRYLRNLGAHSVILDVLCKDTAGNLFNIEVQKDDRKKRDCKAEEYQKQVRYNLSNMDTTFAEKGISYDQLPDLYSVFISEIDPFQQNCTTYHVERILRETNTTVENGIHETYVNTSVNDQSVIAEFRPE